MENKSNECRNITAPMMLNEVSRLFMRVVRREDGTGDKHQTREQHSTRLMLMYLSQNEGVTQSELVRVTRMKAPTISIALKNMEGAGLVRRKDDGYDGRVTRVYITDKGRRVNEENSARLRKVEAIMMRYVDDNEISAMISVLGKMRDSLKEELGLYDEID